MLDVLRLEGAGQAQSDYYSDLLPEESDSDDHGDEENHAHDSHGQCP